MKDQLTHWNNAHAEGWLREHSTKQTDFAQEVQAQIPADASILELGCGEGNDSVYFSEQGHPVVATDFSDVAVRQNQERYSQDNLTFAVQDTGEPFTFDDGSFDAVYARLALHYFTAEVTQNAFNEIARVLKPGGSLAFMCKSVEDGLYGQGTQIEPDMFERDGHVRHFFSERFARELLHKAGLEVLYVQTGSEKLYDKQSAFIKVFAQKPRA